VQASGSGRFDTPVPDCHLIAEARV
jgi:hypothetical protein